MVQNSEAQAFLARILALPKEPGVNLDAVLQPSLDDELQLRRLFATDRNNPRLSDPYVGLVDIFNAPKDVRTTRARIVKDEADLNAKYVMPLGEEKRRKEGEPCMVPDFEEFKRNWSIFTEGSLSQLTDWSNVVAAGGAVQACLAPLSDDSKVSKRATRKYYHSAAFPTSDVDLFLWGLTPEQAEKKIVAIYEAVRDSVPWDVTCVRAKNTISIYAQYPYRSVQIVLRLYHSPAEILAGFDIDAPCCAYDGTRVWANPRAVVAMMRQCNTTDVTRRSPSYEVRLVKYARRGFEVYVPSLIRSNIDPTIFERSIARLEGLARLLVLERLANPNQREEYLMSRRELRGRPSAQRRYRKQKRRYKNDLKLDEMEQLDMNDYDVGSLHIPYGPGWDARRIDKLIYQTDLGMNSKFNPKNKGRRLHRHPAFFGTIQECMEDCCEHCPEPIDNAEKELQAEEDEVYIRGRIRFMQENPGRQIMSGSFNPIDVGEWSTQAYVGPTGPFFTAIASLDRPAVANMIKEGIDVNRRDHVGRSPLHFAIMCNATEIACDLVDAGARMTARLVDGKSALHLAIQRDQVSVVRKLLEKSAQNAKVAGIEDKEADEGRGDKVDTERERLSSEDDWSSEDEGVIGVDDDKGENYEKKEAKEGDQGTETTNREEIPEDDDDTPDVLDLSAADWDHGLTPVAYAVIFASMPILEDLISAGADVKESTKHVTWDVHPLLLTAIRADEDEACKVAERLIMEGASSSPADSSFTTIFLRIVATGKAKLVSAILRCDPNASSVLNSPSIQWNSVVLPIIHAIRSHNYALVAVLLAYGAKLELQEEDITRTLQTRPRKEIMYYGASDLLRSTYRPVETAIARNDDIVRLLVSLGAEFNVCIQESASSYAPNHSKQSILDWVTSGIQMFADRIEKEKAKGVRKATPVIDLSGAASWKEYATLAAEMYAHPWCNTNDDKQASENLEKIACIENAKEYLEDVRAILLSAGAKTYIELIKVDGQAEADSPVSHQLPDPPQKARTVDEYEFHLMSANSFYPILAPKHEASRYHELFQACFDGENEKIKALCLPANKEEGEDVPLQVAVELENPHATTRYSSGTGITPFSIAIENRKWDTARLILAIALAQYEREEGENHFSSDDIELDDDASNHGSEFSDGSAMTVDQWNQEGYYVDISKRPSTMKCDFNPQDFLSTSRMHGNVTDGNYVRETPIYKAIREADAETFVKMLNMIHVLDILLKDADVDNYVGQIIFKDDPELLDELVRSSGVGIDIKLVRQEAKDDKVATNDSNRLYLGLNVHGKKRMDLARRHDPDASDNAQYRSPLLWRALVSGSERIVAYLLSEKPYSAYRSYAMGHSDDRAERLRKFDKLKEVLPRWLGLKINSLGESPLIPAVLSGKIEMIKMLFAQQKELMKSALRVKYKPLNLNILQIAVRARDKVGTDILDFLLAKSVSPLETDSNGFNIYHILCSKNNHRFLKYFLEKLPVDVNNILLTQQTHVLLKTPLHIAAENGSLRAVEVILPSANAATMIRDSSGGLPLHVAVLQCYSKIVDLLIDASPSTLFVEDGVGNVPLETISALQFQDSTSVLHGVFRVECLSQAHVNDNTDRVGLARLEKDVLLLQQAIDSLLKEGRLRKDTKLEKEFTAFVDVMQGHIQRLQQAPKLVKNQAENEKEYDQRNLDATYNSIQQASQRVLCKRELIHLIDVQKSVDRKLSTLVPVVQGSSRKDDSSEEAIIEEKSFVDAYIS